MPEPAPRQLILSLYGLYARPEGNWLSVAALVALMEDLGVDSAAVRSSVSRLKKRGVLEPVKRDGSAGYALSPETLAMLRAGDSRIWSRPRATAADGWLVVVFSVPEAEREKRHALRTLLTGLGFGTAAAGVWIAPATAYDETLTALEQRGLAAYTEFFRGDYLGVGDVSARMAALRRARRPAARSCGRARRVRGARLSTPAVTQAPTPWRARACGPRQRRAGPGHPAPCPRTARCRAPGSLP
jgi:phenylacetic acid degradation operon negative regulatory protein